MRLSRRQLLFASAALPAAEASAATRRPRNEAFEWTELEYALASIDEQHDGLRVAQLSDLHIGMGVPDGRIISAVNAVNEAKPDLVVLTGDFVTNKRDPFSRVPQLLGRLEAPAVAVLGNHDHWSGVKAVTDGLEGIGISVLRNQHTAMRLKGADLSIIGIDDSTTRNDNVEDAFKGASGGPRLVLTHTPSCAGKLPAWEDLLCLSGHTHGGQFEIPGVTRGVYQRAGQPWYRGAYAVRGNQLYVNRGLGFGRGTALPRLNSDPEVTLITLRHREPGAEGI